MEAPIRHIGAQQITEDTFVIRQIAGEGVAPLAVLMNSMVIRGAEPVIVDTGNKLRGREWLDEVFSIVEPADVRWIYLSHEDHDHTGNVVELLARCPDATLVTTWFMAERYTDYFLPIERMRWVNNGESFSVGDRELYAVRPPVFDSPTTRGLFDPRSGVYWAVDAFGTPMPHEVTDLDELEADFVREGMLALPRMVSPWHAIADPARFGASVERIRSLDARYLASGHGPVLHGAQIELAFELTKQIAGMDEAPLPGQADLDAILTATEQSAAAA